ncbi:DUF2812 domain-containing protein [Enterococcus sp. AZ177]|uniref:DUF2812 domain-containing protein n=2 Tax=Enterococcus TaxID=1350 RepID=UPI003D2FAC22
MQLLKRQAEDGWHFEKMNQAGFLVFEKGNPEKKDFSVDFFEGSSEYLVIYKEAGWKNIGNYKDKYYYFKAERETPTIYSDSDSYRIRMKKEWLWLFLRALIYLPIGICFLMLVFLTKESQNDILGNVFVRGILLSLGTMLTVLPLGVTVTIVFSLIIYRDRTKYYHHPERFAKRQKVLRDSIVLAILGAIVGMLFSLLLKTFF